MNIIINVQDKRATVSGAPVIVCGNSGYTVEFTFDTEWSGLDPKTARFVYVRDGAVQHQDVVFTGAVASVPVLSNIPEVYIGVYSGDLCTTTPARVPCERSILCGTGTPDAPEPDVYAQIIALLMASADGAGLTIGSNGNWWIGDEDTGVKAQGPQGEPGTSPHIGDNGNWWIGTTDTGVKAQGPQGDPGSGDGITPHIGDNGNWWLGTKDTGVQAQGPQGNPGEPGGAGSPGEPGTSPHIGDNGNWWIGDEDTGVKAQGPQGATGEPGTGLDIKGTFPDLDALQATVTDPGQGDMYNVGASAPYIIYMYDAVRGWVSQGQLQGAKGTTYTPTVSEAGVLSWSNDGGLPNPEPVNLQGPQGEPGGAGSPGAPGTSPHIGSNGNWWIGADDTGVKAQGPQGEPGGAGSPGEPGSPGAPGTSPHIGDNGNWWIGNEDTGVKAQGPQGEPGGAGSPGAPGTSPHIGSNGNWWIGDEDTGVKAQGPQGEPGGAGSPGAPGTSPHIGDNGNWWIGTTDTGVKAQGPQGEPGQTYNLTDADKQSIASEAAALIDVTGKLDKAGGTMTGALVAQNNENYDTKQVRNVFIIQSGTTLPAGANGDICLVYT